MPFARNGSVEIYYEAHGRGTALLFFSETACAGDIWEHFSGSGVLAAIIRSSHMIIAVPENRVDLQRNIRAKILSTTPRPSWIS